ncbi:transglutaminase family protein [Roseomonas sp. SSH11]|uniref:Transglutaminase family protein n=1 Tax=Pararoseomonas baculiformis TaxID=2820812 RepID=A0ABS4AFY7_9PROT|nr:transglutaminase-like domain-containing protein [Pararoseomonas baculiformis]MBP0445433.1 transglutaminase family protein [Pararoseomonas baculiformis]
MPDSVAEARAAIEAAGNLPDDELDLAAVALQFARIDAPSADWRAAAERVSTLVRAVLAEEPPGDVEGRRALIARVIHEEGGFAGDSETYDDLRNANLIRVTERRLGLPVAIGLLWLHVAEAAGWAARGLDFPGHFLIRLDGAERGGSLVVDPFNGGAAVPVPALRALIKQVEGPSAELRPGVLAPMSRRAVLLRLQTNIRLRRLQDDDFEGALDCTLDMLRLAPDAAPLWREAAVMNARLGRLGAAIEAMERFLGLVPAGEAAERGREMIEEWRGRLN